MIAFDKAYINYKQFAAFTEMDILWYPPKR